MSATLEDFQRSLADHPQEADRLGNLPPDQRRAVIANIVRTALRESGASTAEAEAVIGAYESGQTCTAEQVAEAKAATQKAEDEYFATQPPEDSDDEELPGAEALFRKRMALTAVSCLATGNETRAVSSAVSSFDDETKALADLLK